MELFSFLSCKHILSQIRLGSPLFYRDTFFTRPVCSEQRASKIHTLYNAILRTPRNFLETRENVKILTHPFYHINLSWFSWEWSKKIFFFSKKKFKMADSKKAHFSKSPILKIFSRKFLRWVLGLVGLNDAKGIDVAQCIQRV